jgi:tRNA(Ile)-lysidine synthetase-like protein
LLQAGVPADFELVEQLRKSAGVQISAGSGLFVLRDAAGRVNLRTEPAAEFNVRETVLKLAGRAGDTEFDGVRLDWRLEAGAGFVRPRSQKACEFFDADRVGGKIILRHWRPGDRFQPIGLESAVKLQDLFTNRKIPRARRRELLVAVAANGEFFWVEQLRIGERFKLTPRTRRRLVWRWQRAGLKKTQ